METANSESRRSTTNLLGRADELKDTGLSLNDVLEDLEREHVPPDDDDQP